jgi:hypothetical protein
MASIYEKVLLCKVVKTWEDNDPNLSEVYILQSNNTHNKSQVEIHKDNGKYGIELPLTKPSLNSTREQRNATLIGPTLLKSLKTCSRATIGQPGNKCFTSTFLSLLMPLCLYRRNRIAIRKIPSIKQFSFSFNKH